MGSRFLREAKDDSPKDPKTAELPMNNLEKGDEKMDGNQQCCINPVCRVDSDV